MSGVGGDPSPGPGIPDTLPTPPPAGQQAPTPAQGGPLLVTAVGSTHVATDHMQAHLEQLHSLEEELAGATRTLAKVESAASWIAESAAPVSARRSTSDVVAALHAGRAAHHTATRLVSALRSSIAAYGDAESRTLALGDRLAAVGAAELGALLRAGLPVIGALGLAAWLQSKMPDPGGLRASARKRFFLEHPGLITGTDVVEGVRLVTGGLDEGTSAFLGLPVPLAVLLGATGVTGIRSSARGMLAVGPLLGLFRETPVKVHRVATATVTAPAVGAAQRLERVPEVNQVRIEKYDAPGEPSRFVVYVGPTETFSPVADHEPWDLTSNVGGVGGLDVGAFRASEMAMRDAGVTSGSEVQFVGFSQGGLIASMLVASNDWNSAGIQTFGAPAGNIPLPGGLAGMAVRNTDDFIPMLAGPQLDHHVLQVERQAFAAGQTLPDYHAAPAHQRDAYMATAAVIDRASSSAVREQSAALDSFTGDYAAQPGSTITVTSYHAERVPDATPKTHPTQFEMSEVTPGATSSAAR
ncbi:hypothetical protein BH10ACT6_BH10ACT6_12480 [soil metagenome]